MAQPDEGYLDMLASVPVESESTPELVETDFWRTIAVCCHVGYLSRLEVKACASCRSYSISVSPALASMSVFSTLSSSFMMIFVSFVT